MCIIEKARTVDSPTTGRTSSVRLPGLRVTRQRRVILEQLAATPDHPSADELYLRVRRLLPRISLGTVYRNLEEMSGAGIIQRLDMGGSHRRFDGNPTPHFHVRCSAGGRVDDVAVDGGPDGVVDIRRVRSRYAIRSYRLELAGVCPVCQEAQAALRERPPAVSE
jgi:Fur family ferric uptake transcriptional regulator